MRRVINGLGAAASIAMLAACTSGQAGIEPPSQAVNVQAASSLQFRVGTARFGGATYLNTVVTFRQASGLSATLYNTPTITGPAGFVVPAASSAGTDAGTNHISGTPPTQPGLTAVATTFAQLGGAFAYGFAPADIPTSGAVTYANYIGLGVAAVSCLFCPDTTNGALYNVYAQPLYAATATRLPFLLGPPAVPSFSNGTYPSGFIGYDSGFTMFGATPVAGSYALHIAVPSATIGVNSATFDTSANLASVTPLGNEATPGVVQAGTAGATFTVPAGGAGVTNQILYVVDVSATTGAPTFYAYNVPAGGSTVTLSSGFVNGDDIIAYTVGADYDILAAAPPNNTAQNPTLPAQADVTVSPAYYESYPPGSDEDSIGRKTAKARKHSL